MPKHHSKSFLERMDEAAFWETYVATLLSRAGLYVLHHPTDIDPNGYDGHAYSVDLTVVRAKFYELEGAEDVEVKSVSRELDICGRNILCSQNSYLRKNHHAKTSKHFVFVCRSTGHVWWLPEGTPVELGIEQFDSTRNETYKVACYRGEDARFLGGLVSLVKGKK